MIYVNGRGRHLDTCYCLLEQHVLLGRTTFCTRGTAILRYFHNHGFQKLSGYLVDPFL